MKLVLHIGTEKTGTTLLQDWLYANVHELSSQGVFLSECLGKTNNRLFFLYFKTDIDQQARSFGINNQEEKAVFFQNFSNKFSSEVAEASRNHEWFIISTEHLHSRIRKPLELLNIKRFVYDHFDEVYIICYFRRKHEMAVSLYSTALKHSNQLSLEEFLTKGVGPENYYYNFKKIADNWSSIFEKKYCIFRIYDRDIFFNSDLRCDFIKSLPFTIDIEKLNFAIKSSNESLNFLEGVVYRSINRYVPYYRENESGTNKLNLLLKKQVSQLPCLKYGKFQSPLQSKIEALFRSSNEKFLEEYIGEDGTLGSSSLPAANDRIFSCTEVGTILEQVLSILLPHVSRPSTLAPHNSKE